MRTITLALDFAPLARLKVHLDQDQLVHRFSCRILHLLLVHHNLVRRVISIWANNYFDRRRKDSQVVLDLSSG